MLDHCHKEHLELREVPLDWFLSVQGHGRGSWGDAQSCLHGAWLADLLHPAERDHWLPYALAQLPGLCHGGGALGSEPGRPPFPEGGPQAPGQAAGVLRGAALCSRHRMRAVVTAQLPAEARAGRTRGAVPGSQ